ncbi:hypothetical protein F5Y03DRAFT_213250 [Xylaria venustula]|nr:hypothetical protein F5Y03DRAFT_213250 [Xylaria venustula]
MNIVKSGHFNMEASQATVLGSDEIHTTATTYGTIIGTGVLSLLVCGLRLFTRAFVSRAFSIDDWACLIALAFTTAFSGLGIAATRNGAGLHITHVSNSQLALWFKFYYACTALSLINAALVKTSLLLSLRRLFPRTYIQRYHLPVIIITFMATFTVPFVFLDVFQCNPPAYIYDLKYVMAADSAQHCFPATTVYAIFLTQAVVTFTIDIILLILPIPVILGLQKTRGKWTLAGLIFVPATVACIAPIFRFSTLEFLRNQDSDITYHSASALYWQCIEYNLGMISGSLGLLKPLLRYVGWVKLENSNEHKVPSYLLVDKIYARPKQARSTIRIQGDSVLRTNLDID